MVLSLPILELQTETQSFVASELYDSHMHCKRLICFIYFMINLFRGLVCVFDIRNYILVEEKEQGPVTSKIFLFFENNGES